jgi:lysylphosphatidylglycerol synthetase-like protein (DUF2156 family)
MRLRRALLAVASGICWTLALLAGALAVGAFVGSGQRCEQGRARVCSPPIGLLVGGLVVAVALAVVGSLIYKPKPRPDRVPKPWEYRS